MPNGTERVLVVHGTTRTADVAEQSLRLSGFVPVLTDDPERATWLAAEVRPVAVVIELAIERYDALDLASALRGHPRTRELAIVALAESRAGDVVEYAVARGCDAVLEASCDGAALAAEVERVVARRARRHCAA